MPHTTVFFYVRTPICTFTETWHPHWCVNRTICEPWIWIREISRRILQDFDWPCSHWQEVRKNSTCLLSMLFWLHYQDGIIFWNFEDISLWTDWANFSKNLILKRWWWKLHLKNNRSRFKTIQNFAFFMTKL